MMPHVKTFARYAPGAPHDLAWVIVGSHNLSGAAWGRLEKNETQIAILSYELGVLLSPRLIGETRVSAPFTCTPGAVSHRGEAVPRCLCLANARPATSGGGATSDVRISAAPPDDSPPDDGEYVAFAPLPYRVRPSRTRRRTCRGRWTRGTRRRIRTAASCGAGSRTGSARVKPFKTFRRTTAEKGKVRY